MKITLRKFLTILLCLFLILPWIIMPRVSFSHVPQDATGHKIRALYLYNFLLFVDWPKKIPSCSKTIDVVIYGDLKLYEALKPMTGRIVKGKKLVVNSLMKNEDPDHFCTVLFVGEGARSEAEELLKKVNGKPVLTVSDIDGFVYMGGMVGFKNRFNTQENGKKPKRFIINLPAVHKSRLKIRSRLLRISDVLYGGMGTIPHEQP